MSLPLAGQVALVTGASRGLGAATAILLTRQGAHVVVTARGEAGLAETDDAIRAHGGAATLLPLDLNEAGEVDRLGPSLFQRFGRLDILVSCAATLGRLTPVPHLPDAVWDAAIAVNLTAGFRLIRSCAPLLLAAQAGRAVVVTCASEPRAYWGAYGASKAALEHLTLSWAAETRTSNLRVNLFDPGPMATRLRAEAMPGEDSATLPKPADIAPQLVALCLPGEVPHGARVASEQAGADVDG